MANRLQKRALREAARIVGGEARLAEMLGVPPEACSRWRQGVEPIPEPAFSALLEFLSDMESDATLPH